MFEIEKDVPIPAGAAVRRQGRTKYPFATMAVGDSFFVPGDQKLASTLTSAQNRSGFRFAHWRAEKDGVAGTYVQRIEGTSPIKAPKRKAKTDESTGPDADAAVAPAAELPGLPEPTGPDADAAVAELPGLPEPAAAPAKPGRVKAA